MSLRKATIWYTAGNLFTRFIGFLLLPFYSHLIPAEDFARYSLVMSGYAIMAAVYQGGIFAGFSRYYLETEDRNSRGLIFTSVFKIILVTAVLLSVLITVLAPDIAELITSSSADRDLIMIAGWMLFFDTLFLTILHLLKTIELPGKVINISSFSAVINLILNIYFVYIIHLGIKGILLAQLISGAFAFIILLPVLKQNWVTGFDRQSVNKILLFSLPLLIAGILSTLVDVADRFILDSLKNKETVGVYSFAYRIGIVMNIFVISYRTAWTPVSIRLYSENRNFGSYAGKSFNKLLGVLLFVFLLVSLLSDDLFTNISGMTLFSKEYEPGTAIIPFILIGYAFSGIISFYSLYPYVSGKSYHFLITDALTFIINILLNYLLIPVWGITGAALATTVSFISGALYLRIISSDIRINYEYRDMFLILFGGVLLFAIGYYLKLLAVDIMLITLYAFILSAVLKIRKAADFQDAVQ